MLRDEYKAKRADAANAHGKGSDEYRKWDDAQKTVKRLRATFYGLMGFGRHGYAWGDIDIARTIHGGRTALMNQDECEKLGYPVIYGHIQLLNLATIWMFISVLRSLKILVFC